MEQTISFNVRINFITRLVEIKESDVNDVSKIVSKSEYFFIFLSESVSSDVFFSV